MHEPHVVGFAGHCWRTGDPVVRYRWVRYRCVLRRGCWRTRTRAFMWMREDAVRRLAGDEAFERMKREYKRLRVLLGLADFHRGPVEARVQKGPSGSLDVVMCGTQNKVPRLTFLIGV